MVSWPSILKKRRPLPPVTMTESGDVDAGPLSRAVRGALDAAIDGPGVLPPDLLGLTGMSGRRYREFINRLVGSLDSPRYLEIGSWMGSTFCSAICDRPDVTALAIDDWSEFGGPRDKFFENLSRFAPAKAAVSVLNMDYRKAPFAALGPFNLYLFDGPHAQEDHRSGVLMALPALDREFVLIVDDWNWPQVRAGTLDGIAQAGVRTVYAVDIRTTADDTHPADSGHAADEHSDWHNGYFFAVLSKHS